MIQKKLFQRYFEILEERNKLEISGLPFVFEFYGKFYYVEWVKNVWSNPIQIDMIEEKTEEVELLHLYEDMMIDHCSGNSDRSSELNEMQNRLISIIKNKSTK